MDALRQAGAADVIDFSKESFSEKVKSLAIVVDTLGIDVDSISSNLMQYKGAQYLSTMPSAIRRMQQKGLLQGASIFGSVFGGKPEAAQTTAHWLPEKPGLQVIEYILNLGEAKGIIMPQKAPDMSDYMDAIMWPKDADTGARFGFPAPLEDAPTDGESEGRGRSGLIDDEALLNEYRRRKRGDSSST